jgi:hypothetical protein
MFSRWRGNNVSTELFSSKGCCTVVYLHSCYLVMGLYVRRIILQNSTSRSFSITTKAQRKGRAVAQAVSSWLPTAAARVRARVWSCGICGGQSGAGAGVLRVLRCLLPIFIPPISPQSPSSIIWGWYNRPAVAAVPSGLSLTPLIIIKQKKKAQRRQ